MGVKVYISGISGNKEVKKRQQRVLMILDSRNIEYSIVDITDPGREADRDFMQEKSTSLGATVSDTSPRHPLPPQLFNDEEYCGDYDHFDLSNEIDELDIFLKLQSSDTKVSNAAITLGNGTGEPEVESTEPVVDSSEPAENAVVDSSGDQELNKSEEKEVVESSTPEVVESSTPEVESSAPEVESSEIPEEPSEAPEENGDDNEA